MKTEHIDINTPDGVCDTYIAYPDEGTENKIYPAVILFMDAYGPRQYMYDMAQKLASHGYYVMLPNMFYRVRKAPVVDLTFPLKQEDMPGAIEQIMAFFKTYKIEQAMQDADVFLDFLATQKQVRPGKIGTTGYCMGGALAVRLAARHPEKIAAAASYHAGNLATEMPDSPHLLLSKIKAELYIAHADNDKSMPAEQINRLDAALSASQVTHKSEVYSDAAHGFTMEDLPAYNQLALKRHWESLLDLFARNLPGQK